MTGEDPRTGESSRGSQVQILSARHVAVRETLRETAWSEQQEIAPEYSQARLLVSAVIAAVHGGEFLVRDASRTVSGVEVGGGQCRVREPTRQAKEDGFGPFQEVVRQIANPRPVASGLGRRRRRS